jgi:hypothetical protein
VIRQLPYTGVTLVEASINSGWHARRISMNDIGDLVDRSAALGAEQQAAMTTSRKLSLRLHRFLTEPDAPETVRVSIRYPTSRQPIQLETEDGGGLDRAVDFVEWIRSERAAVAARLESDRVSLVSWLLQAAGTNIVASTNSPSLSVDLPVDVLLGTEIHDRTDVGRIGLDAPAGVEKLHGHGAHGATGEDDIVGGGCAGPGGICDFYPNVGIWEHQGTQKIGVIATYNGRFQNASANYFKQPETCDDNADCNLPNQTTHRCRDGVCVIGHTTWVAGSVGMTGGHWVSVPGGGWVWRSRAGTYITNFRIAQDGAVPGLDWLLTQGVVHGNRSQGVSGSPKASTAWAIDDGARNSFLFLTQSAGNDSAVTAKCPSFNSVCVGSYLYRDFRTTVDDTFFSETSTINPDDAERPHLAGPDRLGLELPDVDATPSSNALTGTKLDGQPISGSSFASPAILSLANQMHLYEGFLSELAHPIVKKAILMAGAADAWGDGSILQGTSWTSDPDGFDGAGAPDGERIKRILDNNSYTRVELTASSFSSCGTNCEQVHVGSVTVPAGYAIRAALAHNSCPLPTKGQTNTLESDFDLWIVEDVALFPRSASSTSLANEVEALYYLSWFSGTFDVFVRIKGGTSFGLCGGELTEPVAIAWDSFFDDPGQGE